MRPNTDQTQPKSSCEIYKCHYHLSSKHQSEYFIIYAWNDGSRKTHDNVAFKSTIPVVSLPITSIETFTFSIRLAWIGPRSYAISKIFVSESLNCKPWNQCYKRIYLFSSAAAFQWWTLVSAAIDLAGHWTLTWTATVACNGLCWTINLTSLKVNLNITYNNIKVKMEANCSCI